MTAQREGHAPPRGGTRSQTPGGGDTEAATGLRSDRIALIARQIRTKRAGARVQVGEADVARPPAGEDTVETRCMALSLREIREGELEIWIAHGLIIQ